MTPSEVHTRWFYVNRIRATIFDIDGTLVDSNDAHALAFVRAFAEFGRITSFENVRWRIGQGSDKLLPQTVGVEADSSEGKRVTKRKSEIFKRDYLPHLKPTPGARDLVKQFKDKGYKLIAATSAGGDIAEELLEAANVADLIREHTSKSDATHSKPDPEIVEAAVKRLKVPPGQIVMLGDTPYDVMAARRAGVRIVGLRCGGWGRDALRDADAVFEHPAELLERWNGRPLCRLLAT